MVEQRVTRSMRGRTDADRGSTRTNGLAPVFTSLILLVGVGICSTALAVGDVIDCSNSSRHRYDENHKNVNHDLRACAKSVPDRIGTSGLA